MRRLFARFVGVALVLLAVARPVWAQTPAAKLTPPVPTHRVEPEYPAGAGTEGAEGDVVLALTVSSGGIVNHADVVESKGATLDAAAVAAAMQWTFTPAKRGDRPIESHIHVRFHLEPPTPPLPPPAPSPVLPKAEPNDVGPAPVPTSASAPPLKDDVEEVQVIGRKEPPSRGASDFNLHIGELRDIPKKNASEILKLAPGILLTNEGGEGHA